MPSIWDLVSYFVAIGGTLHSTYDLLLQHDVVIAGESGVREAGPSSKNKIERCCHTRTLGVLGGASNDLRAAEIWRKESWESQSFQAYFPTCQVEGC